MGVAIPKSFLSCNVILPDAGAGGKRRMRQALGEALRQCHDLWVSKAGLGLDQARDGKCRPSGILGVAVLMRWLLIGLLISVGALLYVAVAATRHVWRQRRALAGRATGQETAEVAEARKDIVSEDRTPKDVVLKDVDAADRGSKQI
jgi:hypothetical protein